MKSRVISALLLVQVLFGLWHVVGSAVLQHLSPPALIGFRVYVSTPILLLLAGVWRNKLPKPKDLAALFLLGGLIIPGNQLLYAQGLFLAGPVNASVLLMLAPVFTLILALSLGHERFSWFRSIGIGLALIGALGLVELERFSEASDTTIGNLILMAAAFCYATYLVGAKGVFRRVGFLPGVAWVFLAGGILAGPWTIPELTVVEWAELPDTVLWMLGFVIAGPTLGTYALNAYALEHAPSSLVGVFITLQPVIAISLAGPVLGEDIKLVTLMWAIPVVVGVILTSLSSGETPEPEQTSGLEESLETEL